MIHINNLCKSYGDKVIFANFNLSIASGEFVSIVGESGCGKSTLFNIIGCLDSFDKGDYFFNNENIKKYNNKQLLNFRKHNIGFIFQNFHLIETITAYQNIEMPLLYTNLKKSERENIIYDVLKKLNIVDLKDKLVQDLSGGEKQRIAIARAIVMKPKVIVADEPTGNLDNINTYKVYQLLRELNNTGMTIIIATHNSSLADKTDRIIKIEKLWG